MRVFWLDAEAARTDLRRVAGRLADRLPEVEEVHLFGSLARGDAAPGSDADLLVILRHSTLPPSDRAAWIRRHIDPVGIGVDLTVYTQAEMRKLEAAKDLFVRRIRSEAIPLHPPAMPADA